MMMMSDNADDGSDGCESEDEGEVSSVTYELQQLMMSTENGANDGSSRNRRAKRKGCGARKKKARRKRQAETMQDGMPEEPSAEQ